MVPAFDCPPSQEVHTPPSQLARTRPAEHEAQTALLDVLVHCVEQHRRPLHLVDDDPVAGPSRVQFAGEGRRVRQQFQAQRLVEQVERGRPGESPRQPMALAGAARTEQEK